MRNFLGDLSQQIKDAIEYDRRRNDRRSNINVTARTNVVRAVNFGADDSAEVVTSTQRSRIKQRGKQVRSAPKQSGRKRRR